VIRAFLTSLVNNTGKVISAVKGRGPRTRVDLQHVPAGLYLMRIGTKDQKSHSLKFIKG
jgi:hypothetical protein